MLQSLHINNFVIVDKADINFESGFTVFSGETGAGKSILVDALSLTLGARATSTVVRQGCSKADITSIFSPTNEAKKWLENSDIPLDDVILIRRTIDSNGRSRAFINGIPSTLTQLKELASLLIDIHGQHAHQLLLRPGHQRSLLDAQANARTQALQVSKAWDNWQKCKKELDNALSSAEQRAHKREQIQWQLDELSLLNLQDNEWETLNQNHSRLANAQSLIQACANALNILYDETASVRQMLTKAYSEVQNIASHDSSVQNILTTIDSALISCTEAISELNSYSNRLELDPNALEIAEQRMSAIFDAARKLKTEPENLDALESSLRKQLELLETEANIEQLKLNVEAAQQKYYEQAKELTLMRINASAKLSEEVSRAMQNLAMEGGKFEVEVKECEPSRSGTETIEFMVSGHAGVIPKQLNQVASGGELARISLALSVIASQAAMVPTLIFDEVDSGIGGRVADVVGSLLKQLGGKHQVLCVTHLPQVAACAEHHFEVNKKTKDNITTSEIRLLSKDERVNEIARMLGGAVITDTTLQHASEMLGNK